MIETYEDFIFRVEELGFMSLSQVIPGLPSLVSETPPGLWHTDDDATDPWDWKDRAADEKLLAYGCILGGTKGFVAPRMYPHFYAAFHLASIEERWNDGLLSPLAWKVWQIFQDRPRVGTREIRRLAGENSGRLDAVLVSLQRSFDLTVSGREYRTGKDGAPFGWPSNAYSRVEEWVPESWWGDDRSPDRREAVSAILEAAAAFGTDLDLDVLSLRWNLIPRHPVPDFRK
jgi:hypothetical protein